VRPHFAQANAAKLRIRAAARPAVRGGPIERLVVRRRVRHDSRNDDTHARPAVKRRITSSYGASGHMPNPST